jgi:nucleoside-diphosphate-sugar epimerase
MTEKRRILVTGSSGFLGSAICVELGKDHEIIGVDCRHPSPALRRNLPEAWWQSLDIADTGEVSSFFESLAAQRRPVEAVLHMAAFYHFGRHWLPEYDRVNIRGLKNILEGACRLGVKRFIFAGSIASLPPAPAGSPLIEASSPCTATAYTRSKTIGESLLAAYSGKMPTLALRIAGVFSDWCELPPLYSLMRLWGKPTLMGRMIPGRGLSGFPYIHRRDLVACVRRILQRHEHLAPCEILFASPPGCTTHNEVFGALRRTLAPQEAATPVYIPPPVARSFLFFKNRVKALLGRKRYERRWMMDYVDMPLVVDTTYTRRKLEWTPGPEWSVVNRMPVLMQRLHDSPAVWEHRNVQRNEGRYAYEPD